MIQVKTFFCLLALALCIQLVSLTAQGYRRQIDCMKNPYQKGCRGISAYHKRDWSGRLKEWPLKQPEFIKNSVVGLCPGDSKVTLDDLNLDYLDPLWARPRFQLTRQPMGE